MDNFKKKNQWIYDKYEINCIYIGSEKEKRKLKKKGRKFSRRKLKQEMEKENEN